MKNTDLRKGNLVLTEHGVLPVHFTAWNDIWVKGIDGRILFARNVEGVEINDELLLKSGFRKNGNELVLNIIGNLYFLYDERKVLILDNGLNGEGLWHIKYFHEIQNLFYWLTKQELELKTNLRHEFIKK